MNPNMDRVGNIIFGLNVKKLLYWNLHLGGSKKKRYDSEFFKKEEGKKAFSYTEIKLE